MERLTMVWVLTCEANDYNQYGEYFEGVYGQKPSVERLLEKDNIVEACAIDLVEKGIYEEDNGDTWYLREEELK